MSTELLTVRPEDPLPTAARAMAQRRVQAAVVSTGGASPVIVTSRDVLELIGSGADPTTAHVADRFTAEATGAPGDSSLKQAAEAMLTGDFQHVAVVEPGATVGIIAMVDVLRRWLK